MIYVASSWRNDYQPGVVRHLRNAGLEVYDFRNPREGDNGFHWSEIDPQWKDWDVDRYRNALLHPTASSGYLSDYRAMERSEAFVLVLPCGRSAHLEAGWACGRGKPTFIYCPEKIEPELMYLMAAEVFGPDIDALVKAVTKALRP